MAKRINPARQLLWRNATDLQLGVHEPVVFNDVTPEQERVLSLLQRGVADEAIVVDQAALLDRIAPALIEFGQIKKPRLSHQFMQGAFDELIRASFATGRDGVSVLENRAAKTVHLDSLGKGGLLIALGLAAAGIGRVLTDDVARVSNQEVHALGYRSDQVGTLRISALEQLLRSRNSDTLIQNSTGLTPAKSRHELAVLVASNAMDPRRFKSLLAARKPHLAVYFESSNVSVSPLISGSPCLDCLNLHRTDADSAWPALASQLVGMVEYLEDARSAMFASAMVVGEILRNLDSPTAEREFIGHRLNVASGRVTEWTWTRHPDCNC
jgi:molybdopterin/thiamine biosynthesis adenylyltransferase